MSDDKIDDRWGTTKCKKFSGTYTEYTEWRTKFMALAEIKGFAKYYKKDITTVKKEEIKNGVLEGTTTNVTKKEKNEYVNKIKAWAFLIMHLTGTAFSIIKKNPILTKE